MQLDPLWKEELVRYCDFFIPYAKPYLFGSRAIGKATERSDIDIILKADQEIPRRKLMQLKDSVEISDIPVNVDFVDWARVSEGFRQSVEKELIPLK